jgi:hypothetical protein
MIDDGAPSPTHEKSAWLQPGFIAAAAVVTLVILLGLILALTGGSDGDAGGGSTSPPAAPATPQGSGQKTDASVCGLPAGDNTVPTKPPPGKWELVGRVAVPTAVKSVGPGTVRNGLRSCFVHSPTGALYAAVNVIAMTASDAQREAFLRRLTAPGVGRDRALSNLGPSSDATSTGLQVAGYSISDYRPSSVVVDLAFRVDKGNAAGYVHLPLALRWLDGDWKLAVPDTGQPFNGMARLPSLAGYVTWKAS